MKNKKCNLFITYTIHTKLTVTAYVNSPWRLFVFRMLFDQWGG